VTAERWMVVDKNRTPIVCGMFSKAATEDEARVLNEEGLEEFRPYRVVRDLVAESCE